MVEDGNVVADGVCGYYAEGVSGRAGRGWWWIHIFQV